MWDVGWTVGRRLDSHIKSNVRNCVTWHSQVARGPFLMTFFTGSPASGWTRNFRLDYVELPWVYNFNRNMKMVLIMLYEIYFIKHYFFRRIHENNSILSQLQSTPTITEFQIQMIALSIWVQSVWRNIHCTKPEIFHFPFTEATVML